MALSCRHRANPSDAAAASRCPANGANFGTFIPEDAVQPKTYLGRWPVVATRKALDKRKGLIACAEPYMGACLRGLDRTGAGPK